MDLDILFWLQNNRSETFAKLMSFFTYFGSEIVAIGIACIVYWCLNRKAGTRLLLTMMFSLMVNQLLKIIFVARRPWVRSEKISPWGNATEDATGYSFPSGHTANAAAIYGGLTFGKSMKPIFKILAWFLVALVAFSRLYLGVHTPQDVLVSIAISIVLIYVMDRVSKKLEENPKLDIFVCAAACLLAVASLILVLTRHLPGDENEVNTNTSDIYKLIGATVGITLGWLMERRLVGFEKPKCILFALMRVVIGLGLVLAFLKGTKSLFVSLMGDDAGGVVRYFLSCFVAVFGWPCLFCFIENKISLKTQTEDQNG